MWLSLGSFLIVTVIFIWGNWHKSPVTDVLCYFTLLFSHFVICHLAFWHLLSVALSYSDPVTLLFSIFHWKLALFPHQFAIYHLSLFPSVNVTSLSVTFTFRLRLFSINSPFMICHFSHLLITLRFVTFTFRISHFVITGTATNRPSIILHLSTFTLSFITSVFDICHRWFCHFASVTYFSFVTLPHCNWRDLPNMSLTFQIVHLSLSSCHLSLRHLSPEISFLTFALLFLFCDCHIPFVTLRNLNWKDLSLHLSFVTPSLITAVLDISFETRQTCDI